MERRIIATALAKVELRDQGEGKLPTITGRAAVFYDADDAGTEYVMEGFWNDVCERIMPGAFDRAIREDDCRALFNHNPDHILGRTASGTCKLSVDAKGLAYEITPPDTQSGRDVVESIRRGDITGSSFAFDVQEQVWREMDDDDGERVIREIHAVKLYDVSPVTYPAYTSTSAAVRSADDIAEAKRAYEAWKATRGADIGAYARRAKAVEVAMRMQR